ncbi:hypothetical protein BJ170DRAFT_717519 [Xylariales sp. AK1849]|nr:hypothetical protein BJ170DRAFT_717519 [Xylariales sp. AK1849]
MVHHCHPKCTDETWADRSSFARPSERSENIRRDLALTERCQTRNTMVGIPKSNRCSFCKSRKTKCDEAWPTCSACKRAERECSGPRNLKFVINGCHSTSAGHEKLPTVRAVRAGVDDTSRSGSEESAPDPTPCTTLIDVKGHVVQEGYSYHRMRLSKAKPQAGPSTTADRLAAKLIYCLDAAAGTAHDLQMWGSSLRLMPPRLAESATLRHTMDLVITAWLNVQRNLHTTAWLDLCLYNRALRSLQDALQDAQENPASHLTTATLSAQTLLQKVEIAYDYSRGVNQESHSAGLITVIRAGGLQQGFSELAVHLIFESFFSMLKNDVMEGRDSIFTDPAWDAAVRAAVHSIAGQPNTLSQSYYFWIEMAAWPSLVKLLRRLYQNPSESMAALELVFRASAVLDYLLHLDSTAFVGAMAAGDITAVQNLPGNDAVPKCYDFSSYELANWFGTHAFFVVVVSRILQKANAFLGHMDESIEQTAVDFSRRIWSTHPWMQRRRPLASDGVPHLCLSWEAGTVVERSMVLAALETIRPNTPSPGWNEATITANAMAFTGRLQFIKTQDWTVELRGIGCRC